MVILTASPFLPLRGGNISAGDLVVCKFNSAQTIQDLGTTIEVLHPVPGAQPQHLIASSYINGCSALALGGSDPCVAALDAHDNPIVSKALTSTRHPIRRSFFRAGVTSA